MTKFSKICAAVAALTLSPMTANAASVKWTFSFEFAAGGALDGAFTYDDVTGTCSSQSATVTGATEFPSSYTVEDGANTCLPDEFYLYADGVDPSAPDLTGEFFVGFGLDDGFSAANAGAHDAAFAQVGVCSNPTCSLYDGTEPFRFEETIGTVFGEVVAPVPLPVSGMLLGLGMGGLVLPRLWARKKNGLA